MINNFHDNSRVTPISCGVTLSTEFRGALRVGELIGATPSTNQPVGSTAGA
ncbi:hypothetical protein SH449x_000789 [Pirellulaceae bacterium SH449]